LIIVEITEATSFLSMILLLAVKLECIKSVKLSTMPLFLIIESRGKKVQDYMLTEENLRKMQGKKPKKSDNQ